jgi:hypothetical protein
MNTSRSIPNPIDTINRPSYTPAKEWYVRPETPVGKPPRISFTQMMAAIGPLPSQTAVLGMCDDRLPVLFDLNDPIPGPLLVVSDNQAGNARLLKTIIDSSLESNSPYEVKYVLVTSKPEIWNGYERKSRDGHCLYFSATYEDMTARAVIRLAEMAEHRATGRELGPAILFVVDDLGFLSNADFDVRANFDWLLKNGPAVKIWPVVGVQSRQAQEMSRPVANFHTRLIGHMPAAVSRKLALFDGLDTECLIPEQQYAVRVEQDWLTFDLPVEG